MEVEEDAGGAAGVLECQEEVECRNDYNLKVGFENDRLKRL